MSPNAINQNRLLADDSNGRNFYFTMRPITQSFPQAIALTDVPLSSIPEVESGNASITASNTTNLDGTPSNGFIHYIKVGNTVTASFTYGGVNPTTANITTKFRSTLPLTTSNFTNFDQAIGNCVTTGASGESSDDYDLLAVASTQLVEVTGSDPQNTTSDRIYCTLTYELQ